MIKSIASVALVTTAVVLAPASASAEPGKLSALASVQLLPVGSFHVDIPGLGEDTSSAATAFGIGGQIDFQVAPAITIGFAPRYILNVKDADADSDSDSASQLDLTARGQYLASIDPATSA